MQIIILSITLLFSGCASYEQFRYLSEEYELPQVILMADYNESWKAVQEVMSAYPLSLQNIESGQIKTDWIDNTLDLNFADSFAPGSLVRGARYKLSVNVSKGIKNRREVTKVTVSRRQFVENDFLQGHKEIPSDTVAEKVLLYRIKRTLDLDKKLTQLFDEIKDKNTNE